MKTSIVQDPEHPIGAEIIAQSIVDIAEAMKKINETRLTRDAIVTLIHERSKISKRDINIVLNNLEQMESFWLKRKV